MKLFLRYALVAFALSGLCFAQANEPAKKAAHATKKKVSANATKEELKALEDKLNAQQKALDALQQQNGQLNQSLQQTQSQLTEAQNAARDAQAKVSALETEEKPAITKLQSDVSDVKTNLTNTAATLQTEQKRVSDLEHPLSIAYKGIRITPVGFAEATSYWRSHATQSDQATPYQSIPLGQQFSGGFNSHLSEFGITARDSRLALRVDADAGKTKLAGYFEGDFFGTGPTSNPNQTTSYTYRIRQAWGRAKFANGWTITGGQMWNLITLNRKGVDADNANLWIPNIIEASYSVGYDWGRYGEIRIGKQLNDKTAVAIAFANPSYVNQTNNTTAGVEGLAAAGNGLWGNSLVNGTSTATCTSTVVAPVPPATLPTVTTTCTNSAPTVTPTYSTNLSPDFIAKVAFDDPKMGHYEVKGLARIFRDRVQPTATVHGYNNTALGYGLGAGAVIPVKPKKVDFIAQGLWGKGISRYQSSGQYDFVARTTDSDFNLQPITAWSVLAGIETHPRPKMELDFLFGDEYYKKSLYKTTTGAIAGYGAPSLVNTGCYYENFAQFKGAFPTTTATALPACTGNNRNLTGSQIVFYYDLYKGPMGTLRYGLTYEYVTRATWSGVVATPAGNVSGAPKGIENMAFTTMRYIFP